MQVAHGIKNAADEQSASQAANPRLTHAAHEFEASLMGELLKPMQKVSGLTGDDEEEEGSGSALAGFATESLARVISERGGFGIADRVLHELNRTGPDHAGLPGPKERA
jgi:flagellar protein FlgJ